MANFRKGSELLQLIDRKKFDELYKKWKMDKGVRTFSTWERTKAIGMLTSILTWQATGLVRVVSP